MKRFDIAAAECTELGINSRTQASELIKQGKLSVDGKTVIKPSVLVSENAVITLLDALPKYVGRGGFKLETAVEAFKINLNNCVCVDIGASTGGFTDCMLQNGASRVYAVDVGKEQLHFKLRCDERVVSLEELDIRKAGRVDIPEKVDFIGIDVSFISLKLIVPVIGGLLKENGNVAALIKPQYETGKRHFKNGILKDKKEHERIIRNISSFIETNNFHVNGVVQSKICGGDGNVEYIIYFTK